ncbi:YbaB/EbfC family nucleoid-associated protein [Mycobacterium kubicae]|uniref:YbaB/EbfC family nucleoid-associated protein n=1 Tax=Mycobacterium kubicae TaxID=120959 RepID=UPI001F119FC6|nr:YbaB/EbfC family nucleoid-associated protein [Mycobacterium kubicae]
MDEVAVTSLAQSVIARAIKQRDLLQSMTEQSKSITARVTSRDRAVSAEVDGLGQLTGLWLGPPASSLDPDALAQLIVDTAHAAARVAAERYSFLLQEFTTRMDELQKAPLTRSDGTTVHPE